MIIGKMNKKVTFKRYTNTYDSDLGQYKNVLTTIATVWAEFYPVRSMESQQLQKYEGKTIYKCNIRFLSGININDFIEYGGETYRVESIINPDLRKERLEIEATLYKDKEDW